MKSTHDVQVTVRVDKDLKERAESLFNRLGMNMSTAFNVFLRKAVSEEGIPFAVSAKNTKFMSGYSQDDITKAFQDSVRHELMAKRQDGMPMAKYDAEAKRAYLEYPDGTREYAND